MKQNFHIILLLTALILLGCSCDKQNEKLYENGVSLELAQYRKEQIKELKYNLFFNIPPLKSEPIESKIKISFTLEEPCETLLDFRESEDKILSINVNGKKITKEEYLFKNHHIILSKKYLKREKNNIEIDFIAGNQSLNRNDEFLYTLLVPDRARTVFPCFEQPNLKALFTLNLEIPAGWEAVSNSAIIRESTVTEGEDMRKRVEFGETEPLSTYLFSFVAGKLKKEEFNTEKRVLTAYHRETEPYKIAQINDIFKEVEASIAWLEEYTGMDYPFSKYSFIILPGFQYGGMEHTGATLYNDNVMFLGKYSTLDEKLKRAKLIAHETAHMWFGDYVTMDWFNDVWTKEAFANYFAAKMTEPLFPNVNHRIVTLKNYTSSAMAEERSEGRTSIRQELDNLSNAGLIYNNIIYNKAPLMMEKLVEIMGDEPFREGIREYLKVHAYGNATWPDLIKILCRHTKHDIAAFSHAWVEEKGMPTIEFAIKDDSLAIIQTDPLGRGLVWPQSFNIILKGEEDITTEVKIEREKCIIPIPKGTKYVLPNSDGRGYGRFIPEAATMKWIMQNWQSIENETTRLSLLMILRENYIMKGIAPKEWLEFLLEKLPYEKNELITSSLVGYISNPLTKLDHKERADRENQIYALSHSHPSLSCRLQLTRLITKGAESPELVEKTYKIWQTRSEKHLGEGDYTSIAYELALRLPEKSDEILKEQRGRIKNPDRLRKFDFISRAVTMDTVEADKVFAELLEAQNRRIEPWAASALSYLNHRLKREMAIKYIYPGLQELIEVQATGDIFFPRNWVNALLGGHHGEAASKEVESFLRKNPDYPQLLKNKILNAAFHLTN